MKNANDERRRSARGRWILGGATLALALGVGAAAHASHRGGGGLHGLGFHRVLHDLDLTEDQEVMAVRLVRATREARRALREGQAARRATVEAQLASDTPDAARLHAMVDEVADERVALIHATIDRFLELHATMTPEQREQLVATIERLEARRRRWHQE